MNRILVARPGAVGERIFAGEAESHHLLDVQRVARGRRVRVSDGSGWQAEAELVEVAGGRAVLQIMAEVPRVEAAERVVILGMPKPAALEEALVLGTEAGATAFVLVRAARSPPGELRAERVERVLRAAVTQCGRAEVPIVRGPVALSELGELPERRWLGSLVSAGGSNNTEPLSSVTPDPGAVIAVGPEGGWTPGEEETLRGMGFAPISLGPYTLRTPTAVAVGLGRLLGDA